MNPPRPPLPIPTLERIDDCCIEFEQVWRGGRTPDILDFVPEDFEGREREILVRELIALDLDYRRRRGQNVRSRDYIERFADQREWIDECVGKPADAPEPFHKPDSERLAEIFPSLEAIELLGSGGMGAVYKARQKGLDRWVAVKILPDTLANQSQFSLRFTREARTLAKLNHPNIVSVHEFGQADGTYYFLMEYVDGPTLREVVRRGSLEPKEALQIVPRLCDALQYAHDRGVIHRDIKPENILIGRDGEVKIVDFGLSRIAGSSARPEPLTATHQIMGTPRYMAPEQFEGSRHVDHRADIYSLGVVFYELLTGELPVGRFEPPSEKVSIDVRLDEVVLRTLEKDPRRRYQAAEDVRSDLDLIASSTGLSTADVPTIAEGMGKPSTSKRPPEQTRSSADAESEARLLITRRELFGEVKQSLRPLLRWQWIQIVLGIGLIAIGSHAWTQNMRVPHRLASGIIVHVYGILLIAAAIKVMVCVKEVDPADTLKNIRLRVGRLRQWYLRVSPLPGLVWWWMWIPLGIALGFDHLMHPRSLYPSLAIGAIGFVVTTAIVMRAARSDRARGRFDQSSMAGSSIRHAFAHLEEIERLGIW